MLEMLRFLKIKSYLFLPKRSNKHLIIQIFEYLRKLMQTKKTNPNRRKSCEVLQIILYHSKHFLFRTASQKNTSCLGRFRVVIGSFQCKYFLFQSISQQAMDRPYAMYFNNQLDQKKVQNSIITSKLMQKPGYSHQNLKILMESLAQRWRQRIIL